MSHIEPLKVQVTLPESTQLLERLNREFQEPSLELLFSRICTALGGRMLFPEGVLVEVVLQLNTYTQALAPSTTALIYALLPQIVRSLLADDTLAGEVLVHYPQAQ